MLNTYDEIDILDSEIENSLNDTDINDNIEILKNISGIGDITSKNFATMLNNINDFSSHKKLSDFIGINPSIRQSGSFVFYQGRITKRGNSSLKRTIYQMAIGVIRNCDKFNAYFHKKIDEGKKYKQAVIAVANKLLKTIFSMLKNKTKFNNSNLVLGVSKVA